MCLTTYLPNTCLLRLLAASVVSCHRRDTCSQRTERSTKGDIHRALQVPHMRHLSHPRWIPKTEKMEVHKQPSPQSWVSTPSPREWSLQMSNPTSNSLKSATPRKQNKVSGQNSVEATKHLKMQTAHCTYHLHRTVMCMYWGQNRIRPIFDDVVLEPLGHGRPRRKSWTSAPRCVFS